METIVISYRDDDDERVFFKARVEKKYFSKLDDIKIEPVAVLVSEDDRLILCIGERCRFVDDFQQADDIVAPMIEPPQQHHPPPT